MIFTVKFLIYVIQTKEEPDSEDLNDIVENKAPLESYTFVVTGVFETIARDRLETFIGELGGRVTSAVSGKTSYLIIGSKLEDGREVSTSSKFIYFIQRVTKRNTVSVLFFDFIHKFYRLIFEELNHIFYLGKYRKAQDKKTPILNEEEFETFLKSTLNNQYFTLDNYKMWDDPEGCKKKVESLPKATVAKPDASKDSKKKNTSNMLLTDK